VNVPPTLDPLLAHARADADVVAVMLFGSAARGEAARDLDVAVVLRPDVAATFEKSIEYAAWSSGRRHEGIDASVFQELPLYVRERVLSDGRALLVNDADALCEIAFATLREWATFRPKLDEYLEGAANG